MLFKVIVTYPEWYDCYENGLPPSITFNISLEVENVGESTIEDLHAMY